MFDEKSYFHIRNIGKIRNLLSYNACSTIIHALISCRLDYCNSLMYTFLRIKLIDCTDFRINVLLRIRIKLKAIRPDDK